MLIRVRNDADMFKSFEEIQREMNRLFDNNLNSQIHKQNYEKEPVVPGVDIFENDGVIYFEMDLPGIEKKDVSLSVEDNVLTLKGERKAKKLENAKYHVCERCNGLFERSFILPEDVNLEGIKATMDNGVLRVELPRVELKRKTASINIQ